MRERRSLGARAAALVAGGALFVLAWPLAAARAGPPAGDQIPGDCNQDAFLDVSDALCLLVWYFEAGTPAALPCGDGSPANPGNVALLDAKGEGEIDPSDAVTLLSYLFQDGPPHVRGVDCTPLSGCPARCMPPDQDGDGVPDRDDNCPGTSNPAQEEGDGDGIGDACDTCPASADPEQGDRDEDRVGDVCDNCPDEPNPDQADRDADGTGDACDDPPLVTYRDVQPIFLAKCSPCHDRTSFCSGDTCFARVYADTRKDAALCPDRLIYECILIRILDGSMPQAGNCSGDPEEDEGNAACLDAAELEAVELWVAAGGPE